MKLLFLLAFIAIATAVPVETDVPILRQSSVIDGTGQYKYGFEAANGITADAEGDGNHVQGSYGYNSPEGDRIEIIYFADDTGFHAEGPSIPVAPPIPPLILRALEYIRNHPRKEKVLIENELIETIS